MPRNSLSAPGAKFISLHEGFVNRYYKCPGDVGTIGIGFTWRSSAFRKWWNQNRPGQKFGPGATMTRAEATALLPVVADEEYGKAVNNFLRKKVPQHVYDGMTSATFNLGPGSLKWRWAQPLKAGDYAGGARILRSGYNKSNGRVLAGLIRRRKEEALLISDGVYTGVTSFERDSVEAVPVDAMADGVLMKGEAGPEVAQLIRDLHKLGYYDGVMDDLFGHGTKAAVVEFQTDMNLTVDGRVGEETFGAIKKMLALHQPPPPPEPDAPKRAPADQIDAGPDDIGDGDSGGATGNVTIGVVVIAVIAAIVAMMTGADISSLME
jgi:GH24 family phage-related lysozyme (muramidase)